MLAAFAAPAILVATFFLAACAHAESPAPVSGPEEQPVIGWRCSEYERLADKVRAALLAPVTDDSGNPQTPPLRYEFALYRDSELGQTVESYVSWTGLGDDLKGKSPNVLYFTIYGRLTARDRLVFRTSDGGEIRLPSDVRVTRYVSSGRRQAYLNITEAGLASRFLQYPVYEVFAERGSTSVYIGKLKLFSSADAHRAHSAMLARIKAKISDPAPYCTPVRAPEMSEESIV